LDLRINQVEFRPVEHEYWYTEGNKHFQLHGVTSTICKLLGKNFPDTEEVQVATIYGHDVHSESEMWIKEGRLPSTKAGQWLIDYLKNFKESNNVVRYEAELKVSDFIGTASCIDIVALLPDNNAVLFDIKTTSTFNREYCSLQLSVYKKLYEQNYNRNVTGLFVLGTKSRRTFRIIEQPSSKVDKILTMNKA
jgi:hypothetical protein